jgi:hypothetical protein
MCLVFGIPFFASYRSRNGFFPFFLPFHHDNDQSDLSESEASSGLFQEHNLLPQWATSCWTYESLTRV